MRRDFFFPSFFWCFSRLIKCLVDSWRNCHPLLSVELVTGFLMTANLHHPNQVKESWGCCVRYMLNQHFWTLQALRYPGLLFKAAAQLEVPKRLLTFESCFCNSAWGGKKKSDLKINHSPIWDATTQPAAPCRLFKQRCQTAGGVHPEGKTTRGSFMRRN